MGATARSDKQQAVEDERRGDQARGGKKELQLIFKQQALESSRDGANDQQPAKPDVRVGGAQVTRPQGPSRGSTVMVTIQPVYPIGAAK